MLVRRTGTGDCSVSERICANPVTVNFEKFLQFNDIDILQWIQIFFLNHEKKDTTTFHNEIFKTKCTRQHNFSQICLPIRLVRPSCNYFITLPSIQIFLTGLILFHCSFGIAISTQIWSMLSFFEYKVVFTFYQFYILIFSS